MFWIFEHSQFIWNYHALQVQRHLQLRIEAQGKYMQTILEKACQTLAGENMASGSYKPIGNQGVADMGVMKDFGPALSFPPFQDLNLYGNDQIELPQNNMDRPLLDSFMQNNENICLGKKRPNPYSGSGKSPLMWSDELRLQDLGMAPASCLGSQDHDPFKGDHIQITPPSSTHELDPIPEIYEAKPVLSGDAMNDQKKFEASPKLERPSPRRMPLTERMNPMMNAGAQGRNSQFG